jgi:hypothetical protein
MQAGFFLFFFTGERLSKKRKEISEKSFGE